MYVCIYLINTLQHTAPHCTTLHHTAPHCTTQLHTAIRCNTHGTQSSAFHLNPTYFPQKEARREKRKKDKRPKNDECISITITFDFSVIGVQLCSNVTAILVWRHFLIRLNGLRFGSGLYLFPTLCSTTIVHFWIFWGQGFVIFDGRNLLLSQRYLWK